MLSRIRNSYRREWREPCLCSHLYIHNKQFGGPPFWRKVQFPELGSIPIRHSWHVLCEMGIPLQRILYLCCFEILIYRHFILEKYFLQINSLGAFLFVLFSNRKYLKGATISMHLADLCNKQSV